MLVILRETPLWVYAVFFLLLYYGVMACFRSNETRRSLLLSPAIFVAWSLMAMDYATQPWVSMGSWIAGVFVGVMIAMRWFDYHGITEGEARHSISVPGSFKLLVLSMFFFAIKYFIGYQQATDPLFAGSLPMRLLIGAASGLTIGLLCGRAWKMLSIMNAFSRHSEVEVACANKK
ncbi:hypothetical protein FBY10_102597 [Pseudomonas sp. SJZ103]|uniref:DUF6622 family protein n=1 Tax=unclassified Pseudomonas TaxID=196821 RepID=UPI0011A0F041|nr:MULTISPECIES: DUF6622 family protein [unclassified Pseudomonas]TWC73851.1 hypothetical protein FBY10_102597 [Pseudomonas sp. SJZ103]TWC83288.1 hypothetical protein FBY08_10910 [Pseudomonas sp. SJZ094]